MRMVKGLLLVCLIMFLSPVAEAGTWSIASASGKPGDKVSIAVALAGDGSTLDSQVDIVFDESRLTLPVTTGTLPKGAANGGACARVSSNRVRVMYLSPNQTPAPGAATIYCNIPFTVAALAPPGAAALYAVNAECASITSPGPTCTTVNGQITITGTTPAPLAGVAPIDDRSVFVLLSPAANAPTPEALSNFDYGSAQAPPLSSLASHHPLSARPLLPFRARGDLKARLVATPNSPRARLERYAVIVFADPAAARAALPAIQEEPLVQFAHLAMGLTFAADRTSANTSTKGLSTKDLNNQYHLAALHIPGAKLLAGGWGLVGLADTGLDTTHPLLASFSSGSYIGGNYLPTYSADLGVSGLANTDGDPSHALLDYNPDEKQPVIATPDDIAAGCALPISDGLCTANTPGYQCMVPTTLGHGSHTTGLIGANGNGASGAPEGTCKSCGIAMMKATAYQCNGGVVYTRLLESGIAAGITLLTDYGVQIINLSIQSPFPGNTCTTYPLYNICAAIANAATRDVLIVAAAGNNRNDISWPANDNAHRVVSAGGVNESLLSLWDESPGSTTNCPVIPGLPTGEECGSNYTITTGTRKQEFVSPAHSVRSTFYRGGTWLSVCSDALDGVSNDGVGLCTGTSMSAPEVSGIFGILRSVNPLAPLGDSDQPLLNGLRNVVSRTTDRADLGLGWDSQLGYGMPNAEAAVRSVLGKVRGSFVRNRVTPLFTLFSSIANDYASVATPQNAAALINIGTSPYSPSSNASTTPSYTAFVSGQSLPAPRANAYILTTEYSPAPGLPNPIPLYWLDRVRTWPTGCSGSPPSCYPMHRDSLLTSSVSEVQTMVAAGFSFRGRQGYVYPACTPEPSCIPAGAERLYRLCNTSADDCAIFPESQYASYQSAGFTTAFPVGNSPVLGYAYPNIDSDGDGLVDGMEFVVGTNRLIVDSDGDGISDGTEFPQAGISLSDPCSGPNITCTGVSFNIFTDGFE